MSYLGSSLEIETQSDENPESELRKTYPYSHKERL
jgi:hypothetical protein